VNYKHGFGSTKNRLYRIWANMKSRCYNPKASRYEHYGGKGVTVCDEWLNDFQAFYDWAMAHGYSDNLTIDRIDVNGNYEPRNCRWEHPKGQSNNLSVNRKITFNGMTKTLAEWAAVTGINRRTIAARLDVRGWSVEKALTVPVGKKVV
jgi:hypothetical protein